jgi:hypothetical protein
VTFAHLDAPTGGQYVGAAFFAYRPVERSARRLHAATNARRSKVLGKLSPSGATVNETAGSAARALFSRRRWKEPDGGR